MTRSRSSHALHRSCEGGRERRKKGWLCIQVRVAQGVLVNTAFGVWPGRKTAWRALKKDDWLDFKDKASNSIPISSLGVQPLALRLSLWYSNTSITHSKEEIEPHSRLMNGNELRPYLLRTSAKLSGHVFLTVRKKLLRYEVIWGHIDILTVAVLESRNYRERTHAPYRAKRDWQPHRGNSTVLCFQQKQAVLIWRTHT